MKRSLSVRREDFALRSAFRIARSARTAITVVTVELGQDGVAGHGECRPYERYGESPDSVMAQIETVRGALEAGAGRAALMDLLPAGAARNAVDCALWDLEAGLEGIPAWRLAGLNAAPGKILTCQTVSLDTPEAMARAALDMKAFSLLKLKLGGGENDIDRVQAVRRARPSARLMADVNEGWDTAYLRRWAPEFAALGVEMIEQPLPAERDDALQGFELSRFLCADESCHTADDLERLLGRYGIVNIKLDKAGGLTHALEMKRRARTAGLRIMVGCMVCSSLALAPALLLAHDADFADLDGPAWLDRDRGSGGVRYDGDYVLPGTMWG